MAFVCGQKGRSSIFLCGIELNGASELSHARMAGWRLWLILFALARYTVAVGNDFLVLRQYGSLDHHSRFSVGGIRKLSVGAVALQSRRVFSFFAALGGINCCRDLTGMANGDTGGRW